MLTFALAADSNVSVEIDPATVAATASARLLEQAVKGFINNRTNSAKQRYEKVIKDGKTATAPDYGAIAANAKKDLMEGNLRELSGEGKGRKTADPLTAIVTSAVVRDLFAKMRAADKTVKFGDVTKLVAGDGIAYLNAIATEKAGDDADKLAAMQKQIESRYLAPARKMLGVNKAGDNVVEDDLLALEPDEDPTAGI